MRVAAESCLNTFMGGFSIQHDITDLGTPVPGRLASGRQSPGALMLPGKVARPANINRGEASSRNPIREQSLVRLIIRRDRKSENPGSHEVRVALMWYKSPRLSVVVPAGGQLVLRASTNGKLNSPFLFIRSFLRAFQSAATGRSLLIGHGVSAGTAR
jgi:hypothetical protein